MDQKETSLVITGKTSLSIYTPYLLSTENMTTKPNRWAMGTICILSYDKIFMVDFDSKIFVNI